MLRSLNIAATGMEAQSLKIDTISNNMANVNTAGFKRTRADFEDLMYQQVMAPGAATTQDTNSPTGLMVGTGVRPVSTQKVFSQGDFLNTNNPLDVAIQGSGFLQVIQPSGEIAYTRAGNLRTDEEGRLVTANGYSLEPEITIPPDATSLTIGADGTISVTQAGQTESLVVGQLELALFANPAGLNPVGKNLFVATNTSGDPTPTTPGMDGAGSLQQGFLEGSNVKIVEEMIDLIVCQRAYETNSKVIQAAEEMLRTTANLKR